MIVKNEESNYDDMRERISDISKIEVYSKGNELKGIFSYDKCSLILSTSENKTYTGLEELKQNAPLCLVESKAFTNQVAQALKENINSDKGQWVLMCAEAVRFQKKYREIE
ncbi:MAG TPA: hypothetical protein EYG70_03995 [Sulfurimonas sp.]|nr:hypothetical protein [Sulfurimonas sp.]